MIDAKPEMVRLGQRLRAARQARGLSQEGLANESGLHRTYVSSVERGQRNPTFGTLLKLSKALHMDLGDLVQGLQ